MHSQHERKGEIVSHMVLSINGGARLYSARCFDFILSAKRSSRLRLS